MTWTPLMCITVIAITFVIGEYLSRATKGYVSSMVFFCFIAMILFWTGSVPSDIAASSTLLTTLGACGTAFLLVNMGSSIDVESLISEWKTVVVCIVGLVGLGVLAFTVGTMVFGRDYSLTAAPVVAGGLIAYQIVGDVAVEAGRPELQGYAALVMAFQSMIGMPVASFCLKNELKKQKRDGKLTEEYQASKKGLKLPETNIFPTVKETNNTSTMKFAKLGIVAVISYMLSTYVVPAINVNIMYLLMGVLFRKINFLDKSPLTSAGGYGYVMLCMYALLFNGFATVSLQDFIGMIAPIFGMLIIGAIGIAIGSSIAGKIVGYNIFVSIACGVTALFGYPATEILSKEVCASMDDFTELEKVYALDYVMPKMIVGGFTTVTIASVVFAGIIAPMIFA